MQALVPIIPPPMSIRAVIPVLLLLAGRGRVLPGAARDPAVLEYLDAVVAKVNRTVITKSQVDRELGAAAQRVLPRTTSASRDVDASARLRARSSRTPSRRSASSFRSDSSSSRSSSRRRGRARPRSSRASRSRGTSPRRSTWRRSARHTSRNTYLAAQAGQFGFQGDAVPPGLLDRADRERDPPLLPPARADEFTLKNQAHVYAISLPYLAFQRPRRQGGRLVAGTARRSRHRAEIREELARGTDFGVLARRYGRELKADEGGDLGWIATDAPYQKDLVDFAFNGPREAALGSRSSTRRRRRRAGSSSSWVSERATSA